MLEKSQDDMLVLKNSIGQSFTFQLDSSSYFGVSTVHNLSVSQYTL